MTTVETHCKMTGENEQQIDVTIDWTWDGPSFIAGIGTKPGYWRPVSSTIRAFIAGQPHELTAGECSAALKLTKPV